MKRIEVCVSNASCAGPLSVQGCLKIVGEDFRGSEASSYSFLGCGVPEDIIVGVHSAAAPHISVIDQVDLVALLQKVACESLPATRGVKPCSFRDSITVEEDQWLSSSKTS